MTDCWRGHQARLDLLAIMRKNHHHYCHAHGEGRPVDHIDAQDREALSFLVSVLGKVQRRYELATGAEHIPLCRRSCGKATSNQLHREDSIPHIRLPA